MSYVKKDRWLELLSEVENLTTEKEELRKGYIDLVVKKNRMTRKSKIKSIIIIVLLILFTVFYYQRNESETQNIMVNQTNSQVIDDPKEALKDSIIKEKKVLPVKEKETIVFSVQIGALRKLKIHNKLNKSSNFKAFKNKEGLNIYSLGEFDSYKAARQFRKQIKKLGFKDAFIVKLKNNKKVPI